jgi:hypothetical protein
MHAPTFTYHKDYLLAVLLLSSMVLADLLSITRGAVSFAMPDQSPSASARYSDWSAPVNLGPNINSAFNETQCTITHQGLSLYFSSNRPGGFGSADIYVSRRSGLDAPWGPPQNVVSMNSPGGEWPQGFSPDDHWMFITSNRPGGFGGLDIWASHRADANDDFGWEAPKNLGPSVNTPADEADPDYFVDPATGKATLYLTSNRSGGVGDNDIYQSTQNEDGSFNPPVLVSELSAPHFEGRMTVRYDGLEIIFVSDRPGGAGDLDLWVSTRQATSDAWSPPINLSPIVNTPSDERAPNLSSDGMTLFFQSAREGGLGGPDQWMTTRRAPWITSLSVEGRKLFVSGRNFDDGAVILLNGQEQRTRNDNQNPSTTLISKKAGRRIKPGDRVQVQDPNGTLSQEFNFSGVE